MLKADAEAAQNTPAATFLTGLQVADDAASSLHSSEADAAATAHADAGTEDDSGFVGRTLLALDLQRTSYLSEKFQVCFLLMNFSIYIHFHCLQK
jgi:hypothetical protein